ncbi:MAG: cytochrome c oxidase subunit I, partial [bacterium]
MRSFYEEQIKAHRPLTQTDRDAIATRVAREVHENGFVAQAGQIRINETQVFAFGRLQNHYKRMFTDPSYPERFSHPGYITDSADLEALAAYFFWGAWVSAADRPGETHSYTHNWPYDPEAGNRPTSATLIWSLLSILALFVGCMLVLYVYGQMRTLLADPFNRNGVTLTTFELERGGEIVRPTQRSTYKFFAFAVVLFVVQVLAGIL